LDGDADRLIYYYLDDDLKFHLLDGDKIALLLVDYMSELVKKSNLTLNFGIIQTAYANGNATKYATSLGIPVTCAPTGVKYLHRAAQDYDVGVYFEANGHGTVVFSDKAREEVRQATLAGNEGAKELGLFMDVINSTVGDAISDMLCVETALRAKGWDPKRWEAMYFDLPSRLLTVTVLNREWVETTDAEREVTKPVELARKLKSVAKKYPPTARAFVRPSGTEEIVRVYAEAEDQETADQYAAEVEKAVIKYCGIIPDDTPIF
jgi:phosphoacetylglucosamine mutase